MNTLYMPSSISDIFGRPCTETKWRLYLFSLGVHSVHKRDNQGSRQVTVCLVNTLESILLKDRTPTFANFIQWICSGRPKYCFEDDGRVTYVAIIVCNSSHAYV